MRTLGNILTGNDKQSTEVLKNGALDVFFSLLCLEKNDVSRRVCNVFSNAVFGNEEFVSLIVNNCIYLEKLVYFMNAGFIDEEVLLIYFNFFKIFYLGSNFCLSGD